MNKNTALKNDPAKEASGIAFVGDIIKSYPEVVRYFTPFHASVRR